MIKNILTLLALFIVGYYFGRYVQPAKVEIQVVKEIQTKTVVQHDTTTTTTETENKDGSKTVTTVIVNKDKDNTSIDDKSKSTTIQDNRSQWKATVQLSPKNPQLYYFYGVSLEKRVLGPIFVGGYFNMDHTVGVSLGLEL